MQKKAIFQTIGNPCSQPPQSPNQDRCQMGSIEVIETSIHKDLGFITYFFHTRIKQRRFKLHDSPSIPVAFADNKFCKFMQTKRVGLQYNITLI